MQSNQPANQVTLYQDPADSQSFSLALRGLTGSLMAAAAQSIDQAIGEENYTALERRAMVTIEALRLTSGMDLAAILTRGSIILQIETEGLVTVHPNQYSDLSHMAREQGISVSELSDTKALCEVIFPYIVDSLHMSLAEVWQAVGKSGFRELTPALRSIITGEDASHTSVRTAVETLLNQAAVQLAHDNAAGTEDAEVIEVNDTNVRRQAVASLLHSGATLPSRELRRTIRPTRTPNLNAITLAADNQWYAVIKVNGQDQYDMLMRLLGTHVDNQVVNGSDTYLRTLRALLGE